MFEEMEEQEDCCNAMGLMVRDTKKISVTMVWHMAHTLSDEFISDFLKLRCKALKEVFGNIDRAPGIVRRYLADEDGNPIMGLDGNPVVTQPKVVHRPKHCQVMMGFEWPYLGDAEWKVKKDQFKEVFDPAALHGAVRMKESDDGIQINSQFMVAEKGGS